MHIHDVLSEEVKEELDKYNLGVVKKANYQPNSNRIPKVHKQGHGDEDPSKNPEPDLNNYNTEDSYPLHSHGSYYEKMAFSYHISSIQLLTMGLS